MSTQPEPDPTEPEPTQTESNDEPGAPVEPDPPVEDPEPEENAETPPPPDQDGQTALSVEPGTWYQVESVCVTATCPNLNTTTTEPMVYSNAGTIRMVCGVCGQYRPILQAVKRDPQPEMS